MTPEKAVRRNDPTNTSKPKLFTTDICPFAERARLACQHLCIDCDFIEVDLDNKPAELFKVNSKGLVPAIDDQGFHVIESTICVLYLDETWESPTKNMLLPKDPIERATVRMWIDFVDKKYIPEFYKCLLSQDKEAQENAKVNMLNALSTLSKAMSEISPTGPFFLGNEFGLFEVVFAPYPERFPVLQHYRNFTIPDTEEYARFNIWFDAVQKHPTFIKTKVPTDVLVKYYIRYANNTTTSKVADAIRAGKVMP